MDIASFLIGLQAGQNKAGGGSSADVRYVTFMSYDGSVEYGKKAVAVGDDCADPIARGVFDTPTRESTVQYNYTFYGWATTANGAADASWNKSITEDKTVYTNFASAVRYYTITYYDSDGTTVLKTESLAYGATPSYAPTKDDYLFDGWNSDVTAVTGDAAYTATWVAKPLFSTASWEEIDAICQAGNAASAFNIGDTKIIAIPIKYSSSWGPTLDIEFQIVGFNIEDKEDGTKAAITIASTYPIFAQHLGTSILSDLNVNGKGWGSCGVRASLNDALLPKLASDLQAVIKPVKKVSNAPNSADGASNVTTVDKLWIPSVTEYGLSSAYTAPSQGYEYPRLNAICQTPALNYDGTLVGDTSNNSDYANHNTRSDSSKSGFPMIINFRGKADSVGATSFARMCFCI